MAAEGKPILDLVDRPVVATHLAFHWQAFSLLSSDRSVGFGVGPIPWTAIDRYAERKGIDDPDELDRFVHLMRSLDRVFVEWHRPEG